MRKSIVISTVSLRITICIFICLSLFSGAQAQQTGLSNEQFNEWKDMIHKNNIYVSAYMGSGSFSMYGMRRLQKDLVTSSGLNAIVNSDFPSFLTYGISISEQFDQSRFGFDLESMSTGARSSIADYSGQYTSDFICSGLKLGVFIEKNFRLKINGCNDLSFGYRLEAGGIGSEVIQQSQIIIYNLDQGTQTAKLNLVSVALFFEPTIYANWQILRKTTLQLSTGYMLDIPPVIRFGYYSSSSEYQIGWAGYRIKLGLIKQF